MSNSQCFGIDSPLHIDQASKSDSLNLKQMKPYMWALGDLSGGCCNRWGGSSLHTGVSRAGGTVFTMDEHDGEVVGALNSRAWHGGGGHNWHTFILERVMPCCLFP